MSDEQETPTGSEPLVAAGRELSETAHLDAMTTRKPTLPPKSHIDISFAVTTALTLSGASTDDVDSLPAKVREALDYFTEVADVAAAIEHGQPDALKEYRDEAAEFLAAVNGTVTVEEAAPIVDALFSSHLMARLLGDVAVGNIEPVATVAKNAKDTPKTVKAKVEPNPDANPDAKTTGDAPEAPAADKSEQDQEKDGADPAPADEPKTEVSDAEDAAKDDAKDDAKVEPAPDPTATSKRGRSRQRRRVADAEASPVAPAPADPPTTEDAATAPVTTTDPVVETTGDSTVDPAGDDFDPVAEPVLPPDPEDFDTPAPTPVPAATPQPVPAAAGRAPLPSVDIDDF